jgi:hypothetical protein
MRVCVCVCVCMPACVCEQEHCMLTRGISVRVCMYAYETVCLGMRVCDDACLYAVNSPAHECVCV